MYYEIYKFMHDGLGSYLNEIIQNRKLLVSLQQPRFKLHSWVLRKVCKIWKYRRQVHRIF